MSKENSATAISLSQGKTKLIWLRRTIQSAMLLLLGQWSFYGIFRCPFAVPFVNCQSCPVITCMGRLTTIFWGFWLLLPVSAVLFGRAFCGWLCPGGLLNQLLGLLAPFKLRHKNRLSAYANLGKYLAILAVLYLFYALGNPRWAIPIRTAGDFREAVLLTLNHAENPWLIRSGLVIGLVGMGLIMANLWCRFACPTGGILEIFKRFAIFHVYKDESCNDCNRCLKICAMATRPAESNCTSCGDCLDSCPQDAIKFGHEKGARN